MVKKLSVLLCVSALLCLVASPATASLVLNIEATTLNGGALPSQLQLSVGDVLGLAVYGTVSTGLSTDGVALATGSIVQKLATVTAGTWNTEVKGTFSTPVLTADYAGTGSHTGANVPTIDPNSDGFYLDIGTTATGGTAAYNYVTPVFKTTGSTGPNGEILATLTYTVTAVNAASGLPTVITWQPKSNGSSSGWASWTESGSSTNPSVGGVLTAGSGVSVQAVVPEPATLVMLGMACMALLAIRRRK